MKLSDVESDEFVFFDLNALPNQLNKINIKHQDSLMLSLDCILEKKYEIECVDENRKKRC